MTVKTISTQEIAKKVMNQDDLFVLDVRGTGDFNEWKLEGENAKVVNTPFYKLREDDTLLEKLPKDRTIYTMCAKGNSSKKAAAHLKEKGFEHVYSIEGGMSAWSEHLEPVKIGGLSNGGSLYQFVRLGKGCLSYLIESEGKGAVVDTNRMTETYEAFAKTHGIQLTHLLDTHLHADHISGGKNLAEKVGGTYYLPPKDAEEAVMDYNPIQDGDEIKIGNTVIQAIYSPGHTIGSTSFLVDGQYLLTGDILFIDSIGRPDLAGKAGDWVKDLRQTLYERYKKLADDLLVLPAHFMGTNEVNEDGSISETLGVLYKQNHGLNIPNEEEFRRTVTENLPPQPNAYEEIREMNMGKITPDLEKQREMETGPNRCAVR